MKKQRSLRIALLVSLSLFGALIYYTSNDRAVTHENEHATISFGLDLDLKWIADADQADFTVVQDTLHHYAGALGLLSGLQSSRFRIDHLADPSLDAPSDMYKVSLSMDFEEPDASHRLLTQLVTSGYLSPAAGHYSHGFADGETALHLPIPGTTAQVLDIDGAAYHLRIVPRAAESMTAEPEA